MELLIASYITIIAVTGLMASWKRRSVIKWCVGSLIIGILAPLILLFIGRGHEGMKRCGECMEFIEPEANVCKHCGFRYVKGEK